MTVYFVSRHPGAHEWAMTHAGIQIDQQLAHLDLKIVHSGDWIIGSLPVNLASKVCALGARYFHLSLELPAALRGQELSAEQLAHYGAKLEEYHVMPLGLSDQL